MLIDGQCLRSFSTLERTATPHDKCPAALMAQENGHSFGRSGLLPELAASNDTIAECTARVDQLLSKHSELSDQQKACEHSPTDKACTDNELQALRRAETDFRSKIRDLEHPLQDVDAVTLSEAELAPIQALQSDDVEQNSTGPCDMSAEDIPSSHSPHLFQSVGAVPMDCADERLQPAPDAAQQDPLRSQQDSLHGERQGTSAIAHVFGTVPAFTPLPEDPTVAMIQSCNRYTSSVSHLETFQNMRELHQAVQGAQHYMSGRHHVMFVRPTIGALWSLPVVQQSLEQHTEQVESLVATLRNMEQSQEAEADARAAGLAVQLANSRPVAVVHDEADPVRVAVREHMHNFSCHIPSQLDEHGRWRSTFVESNRLVADPKQELALPKFTRPWTKQEKEAMENVLGESGKQFAEVANKVGTRNIAECIDRYYKIHLRDEFKPTWRKMARLKRATEGRNKRNEESKVLATVTKVPRHRYDSLPRQDSSTWRFPAVSDERLRMVPPVTARDFDNNTQLPLASEDSLKGHSRQNGRKRVMGNVFSSPSQPLAMAKSAALDHAAESMSLLPPGSISFGDLTAGNHTLLGASASLPASLPSGTLLGVPPLAGLQPLPASASLLPLPEVPIQHPFPKGGGSVQPSLKFQMSSPPAPMLRPVANGNMGHAVQLHGGQLQNIVPSPIKGKVHAQPEDYDGNDEHWQKNPPTS